MSQSFSNSSENFSDCRTDRPGCPPDPYPPDPFPTEKRDLRRSLLTIRQSLTVESWRDKSNRLCAHLQTWPRFTQARTILAYFSVRQEPDLSPLWMRSPLASAQRWGVPRCVDQAMVWHQWTPGQPLNTGAYRIPEPLPDAPMLTSADVDLILVPAVACDRQGYRLGYGGGFYDRMLSAPEWASIPTIGIVFEFAYLPQLPIEPWDQTLQGICTEAGLFLSETLRSPPA